MLEQVQANRLDAFRGAGNRGFPSIFLFDLLALFFRAIGEDAFEHGIEVVADDAQLW